VIELWELRGRDDRRYSLFSWRTRMALMHKGLAFETRPVLMGDKAAIAFSGGKTVPAIKDGDTVLRDSWKIAEYLEEKYPQKPLFGGAIGHGLAQTFNAWADRGLLPLLFPALVLDIHGRADPADQAYVRGNFEKIIGRTLEEAHAARAEGRKRFERAVEPMQAALKRQPFVSGEAPAYGDYILFSFFQWARVMSPEELLAPDTPLHAWRERMLDLYDGYARKVPAA
jgi:glutathione S-transferase